MCHRIFNHWINECNSELSDLPEIVSCDQKPAGAMNCLTQRSNSILGHAWLRVSQTKFGDHQKHYRN